MLIVHAPEIFELLGFWSFKSLVFFDEMVF